MTAAQVRGMRVFFSKAKYDACHEGVNFTLNAYANLGVGTDQPQPDVGRYPVTENPADWGFQNYHAAGLIPSSCDFFSAVS
jgi:cytochrome c peroxidase